MKATVDRDVCIGCEFCASMCPKVFTIKMVGEDEKSFPIEGEIPEDVLDLALEVETQCPVAAIAILED